MEIEEIVKFIDEQFEHNKLKNIFLKENRNIKFNSKTEILLNQKREDLISVITGNKYNEILDNLAKKFIRIFLESNKYIRFSKEECKEILEIYNKLFEDLINTELKSDEIEKNHYNRIRNFIKITNKFVYDENKSGNQTVNKQTYSEYTPKFQLNILDIKLEDIKGKILDLGCGKDANLVKFLRENGKDAYGIDRECVNTDYTEEADWLDIEYGEKKYDTIISNISFTSHFLNNHARNDGDFEDYAITYMKILNSLKIGGVWYYAPSLEFIEELLPEEKFEVVNSFVNNDSMRTSIKRIS